MNGWLVKQTFKLQMRKLRRDWPSVEAALKASGFDKSTRSFPQHQQKVIDMMTTELANANGAIRPRADVDRCAEDAANCFFGSDWEPAMAELKVPAHLIVAENMKWDGQKPFISDAKIAPWRTRLPNLTVQRVRGNHITVVFEPEVLAAIRS